MSNARVLSQIPVTPHTFRNKLINGTFDIWQRGTSQAAAGYGSADRWSVAVASGQTYAGSQQAFTLGNAIPGFESAYYYRAAWSGTPSGSYWLEQRVEDVRTFAGQTVTLSFWAKASSATGLLRMGLEQNFGSGGSSVVSSNGNLMNLTTSWQFFSQTFSVPSISGKTIGTSSFLSVRPLLGSNSVAGINIDIWGVQLEAGGVATPFEFRPIGTELALCQRYCQRVGYNQYDTVLFGTAPTTTEVDGTSPNLVSMRANPAVSIVTGSTFQALDEINTFTVTLSGGFATQPYIGAYFTGTGLTTFRPYRVRVLSAAGGGLIYSAEL